MSLPSDLLTAVWLASTQPKDEHLQALAAVLRPIGSHVRVYSYATPELSMVAYRAGVRKTSTYDTGGFGLAVHRMRNPAGDKFACVVLGESADGILPVALELARRAEGEEQLAEELHDALRCKRRKLLINDALAIINGADRTPSQQWNYGEGGAYILRDGSVQLQRRQG